MMASSTNQHDFVIFLNKVKRNMKDPSQMTYLVYDGAHTSHMAQDYLDQNFKRMQCPAYSCQFNSIGKYMLYTFHSVPNFNHRTFMGASEE